MWRVRQENALICSMSPRPGAWHRQMALTCAREASFAVFTRAAGNLKWGRDGRTRAMKSKRRGLEAAQWLAAFPRSYRRPKFGPQLGVGPYEPLPIHAGMSAGSTLHGSGAGNRSRCECRMQWPCHIQKTTIHSLLQL